MPGASPAAALLSDEAAEAQEHEPPAAPGVPQAPSGDQHQPEGQGVAGDHPLDGAGAGAEPGADRGQGDVDDRDVEQRHEADQQGDGEDAPPARVGIAPRPARAQVAPRSVPSPRHGSRGPAAAGRSGLGQRRRGGGQTPSGTRPATGGPARSGGGNGSEHCWSVAGAQPVQLSRIVAGQPAVCGSARGCRTARVGDEVVELLLAAGQVDVQVARCAQPDGPAQVTVAGVLGVERLPGLVGVADHGRAARSRSAPRAPTPGRRCGRAEDRRAVHRDGRLGAGRARRWWGRSRSTSAGRSGLAGGDAGPAHQRASCAATARAGGSCPGGCAARRGSSRCPR